MNNEEKLNEYYKYFCKYYLADSLDWYKSLKEATGIMNNIRSAVLTIPSDADESEKIVFEFNKLLQVTSEGEINNLTDFLNYYIFWQHNSLGDISQGSVWGTKDNPHKKEITERATVSTIIDILKDTDIRSVERKVQALLKADRNYEGVKYRFLRALFPDKIAARDAPAKLNDLINLLHNKLSITITGDPLEKHLYLMGSIEDDACKKQIFFWDLPSIINNKLSVKRAMVYYGAPGTGKTYGATELAKSFIDQHRLKSNQPSTNEYRKKVVQFHPSYAYEDFVEGIRPTGDKELKLTNGVFKQFCKDNSKQERALYKTSSFLDDQSYKKRKYDFRMIGVNELTYEEKAALGVNGLSFGSDVTISEILEPAFFIIDEINRAELSRVFGELMYSLEYRGYEGKIKTQYSYLSTEESESCFFWENGESWFFVPQNIYLIGTMNNIDRSVDSFDFALRRRFFWKEIEPDYDVIKRLLKKEWKDSLANSFKSLNDVIQRDEVLGGDYRLGHSYALDIRHIEDQFEEVSSVKRFLWKETIHPLLQEYLRGLGNEAKMKEKLSHYQQVFFK